MSAAAARSTTLALEISELPSIKDGISVKEEADKRRKTCRFIEEAGRILKLPRVAVATAMVFFHRFYAKHSFAEHDRFEVAVACLLLAAKTEEAPKKLVTVIDECYKLKHRGMAAGRISQNSPMHPTNTISTTGSLDPKGEEFLKLKERILLLERVILHTIGFELSIDHPYKSLVDQIKKLIQTRQLEYIIAPSTASSSSQVMSKMMNELVQYSMNFANDSMHTSLCLQFPASTIATACVYLGAQFAKVRPTGGKSWLEVLGYPDVESLACKYSEVLQFRFDYYDLNLVANHFIFPPSVNSYLHSNYGTHCRQKRSRYGHVQKDSCGTGTDACATLCWCKETSPDSSARAC
jgi:cyclin T